MATATLEREAREYVDAALDPRVVHEMASHFGNENPAPPKSAGYDMNLRGTPIIAYYRNPQEIVELAPEYQRPIVRDILRNEFGSLEPYVGLNPDLPQMARRMGKDFAYSVLDHEKTHAAQPKGKFVLKGIYATTPFGELPIGEMIVEGSVEYALERRGKKPPSRYFDEQGQGKAAYSYYRDFVYEIEEKSPGITRQLMRAASRGGPNAAIRLIESVPDMGAIVAKYAYKLNNRMN